MNELVEQEGVLRRALATLGVLKSLRIIIYFKIYIYIYIYIYTRPIYDHKLHTGSPIVYIILYKKNRRQFCRLGK